MYKFSMTLTCFITYFSLLVITSQLACSEKSYIYQEISKKECSKRSVELSKWLYRISKAKEVSICDRSVLDCSRLITVGKQYDSKERISYDHTIHISSKSVSVVGAPVVDLTSDDSRISKQFRSYRSLLEKYRKLEASENVESFIGSLRIAVDKDAKWYSIVSIVNESFKARYTKLSFLFRSVEQLQSESSIPKDVKKAVRSIKSERWLCRKYILLQEQLKKVFSNCPEVLQKLPSLDVCAQEFDEAKKKILMTPSKEIITDDNIFARCQCKFNIQAFKTLMLSMIDPDPIMEVNLVVVDPNGQKGSLLKASKEALWSETYKLVLNTAKSNKNKKVKFAIEK